MSRFVYRLAFATGFVYRECVNKLHKSICGYQNTHKLACGAYFGFCHPQAPSSRPHRELDAVEKEYLKTISALDKKAKKESRKSGGES